MQNGIETVFLDAGGVLVFRNWRRVSAALAREGVRVEPDALARAEPLAKKSLDVAETITATNDTGRGWLYFNLILEQAGVPLSPATDAALSALHEYHAAENLWEFVPDDVPPALAALRALGLRLVVVSNANGRLRHLLTRLNLAGLVDVMIDSDEEGVEKPDPALFRIALDLGGEDRRRRPCTSAICITSTSLARARPVWLRCCSILPISTRGATVRESARSASSRRWCRRPTACAPSPGEPRPAAKKPTNQA